MGIAPLIPTIQCYRLLSRNQPTDLSILLEPKLEGNYLFGHEGPFNKSKLEAPSISMASLLPWPLAHLNLERDESQSNYYFSLSTQAWVVRIRTLQRFPLNMHCTLILTGYFTLQLRYHLIKVAKSSFVSLMECVCHWAILMWTRSFVHI